MRSLSHPVLRSEVTPAARGKRDGAGRVPSLSESPDRAVTSDGRRSAGPDELHRQQLVRAGAALNRRVVLANGLRGLRILKRE